jgi:hypothetical protein
MITFFDYFGQVLEAAGVVGEAFVDWARAALEAGLDIAAAVVSVLKFQNKKCIKWLE